MSHLSARPARGVVSRRSHPWPEVAGEGGNEKSLNGSTVQQTASMQRYAEGSLCIMRRRDVEATRRRYCGFLPRQSHTFLGMRVDALDEDAVVKGGG